MPTVVEMIRALRGCGWSPDKIAEQLGVTAQAIASWESGRVKKPRGNTVEALTALHQRVVSGLGGDASLPAVGGLPAMPAATAADGPGDLTPAARRVVAAGLDSRADSLPLPERRLALPPRTADEAFRFIHCADLHIDSSLRGLRGIDPRYADWIRTATRQAFTRLVDLAIDDAVDFVVIAGDLYDDEWKSADTGIFVTRQLARLAAAGIRVFAVAGNHDALSVVTRSVRWPETARCFGETAESVELETLGVAIHGRSFGDRHVGEDFVTGYPPARAGMFNLGLLHTSLTGATGHATYAPCSAAQLTGVGYDYWALGHVHIPRVVQTAPHIVFSGNIQGRDIGETGPRGCYVVTVDRARRPTPWFIALDDVRWERLEVAVESFAPATVDDVVDGVVTAIEKSRPGDDRLLACRVALQGQTPLHRQLFSRRDSLRDEIAATAASLLERVCLEKVEVKTSLPDSTPRPPAEDAGRAISLLAQEFERLESTPPEQLLEEVPELKKLFNGLRALDSVQAGQRDTLQSSDCWATFIAEARQLLEAELEGSFSSGGAAS